MPYFMALDAMPSNALAPNPQTYEDAWMTYDGKWGCHFPESENYIVYVDSFKWMATEKFPYRMKRRKALMYSYVRYLDNYIPETQRFAKGLGRGDDEVGGGRAKPLSERHARLFHQPHRPRVEGSPGRMV
jgi:hypothetical protein